MPAPSNLVVENVCQTLGQSACLFGDCVLDAATKVSHCICHAGFTHDVMWTRLENCGMPVWWPYFVYAPCLACCVLSAIYMHLYFHHLKGGMRRTLQAMGAFIAALAGASISFMIEGFASRAFFVFNALCIMFLSMAFGFYSITILDVTIVSLRLSENKTIGTRLKWLKIAFWFSAILLLLPWTVSLPVQFALGDPTDPSYDVHAFNLAATIPFPLMWMHNFIFFPSFVYAATLLIRILDDSLRETKSRSEQPMAAAISSQSMNAKLKDVRYRLNLFLWTAAGILAPMEAITVWIPIILYLTKAPGMWLFMEFTYGFEGAAVLLVLIAIKSKRSPKTAETALSNTIEPSRAPQSVAASSHVEPTS